MEQASTDRFKTALLLIAALGLLSGLAFYFTGQADLARMAWLIGVIPPLVALLVEILRSIGRGEIGLDILAALSMTAALVFGENLAAAVVDLLSRVPRMATRHRNGWLEDVPLDEIAPGDRPERVKGSGAGLAQVRFEFCEGLLDRVASSLGPSTPSGRRGCLESGRQPGTIQTFGRDLKAAFPALKVRQHRDVMRSRAYVGIRLG